jgi:glycosyltransferase involved in cell wall biosynthesis
MRFTFAVVGRDEAATLGRVLEMAFAAARPGDAVWFVDSASADDSARLAAAAGAEVVAAPAGKGRAIAAALARCREGRLVLLDADLEHAEHNLAVLLRDAALADPGAAMVVGEVAPRSKRSSVSPFLYQPLATALFPEAPVLRKPLSGFRVLDAERDHGAVPDGYGAEAHLNLEVAATGGRVHRCELGPYRGPLRGYAHIPVLAADVAAAVLDAAEVHGRLAGGERPAWDEWAAGVLRVIGAQPRPGAAEEEYFERLRAAAARPLPVAAKG